MVTTGSESQMIVRRPRVQGGEPVIRGTRVPVRSIVIATEEYEGDLTKVAAAFTVDEAAVRAALGYYRRHKAEIDRSIAEHEQAALA